MVTKNRVRKIPYILLSY